MGGDHGTIIDSLFTHNTVISYNGGGIDWSGPNGKLTGCIFTNNTSINGGGVYWSGDNGTLTNSNFTNNSVTLNGGAVSWSGDNGIVTGSIFTGNTATGVGGGIDFWGNNCTVTKSTFTSNTATKGGAIWWNVAGSMANCNFINSKSQQNNGIYANKDLKVNGGNGIVYAFINNTLSGASIVVLNNETYYYPPNSNINLTKQNRKTTK